MKPPGIREPAPPPAAIGPARATARRAAAAWLDVRGEHAFARGHLPGCGNVPLDQWAERRHELPPPGGEVIVVADDPAAAQDAAHRLSVAGYARVEWLDVPWSQLGLAASHEPAALLWRPASFLERVLPLIPRGRALDVASGAGREAVFLGLNGFEVEAWDRDANALGRARALAERTGAHLRTVTADLETEPPPAFTEGNYALILCFRYLHRPLFPVMARALQPGGHLVYETYREGQERYGRPRRARFLLRSGELPEAFGPIEVLEYQETAPEGGPVMARLHARKPGA